LLAEVTTISDMAEYKQCAGSSEAMMDSTQDRSVEAIMEKFEQMEKELGDDQFDFVVIYIFDKGFRAKVYEEKKLREALNQDEVQKEEINRNFGSPVCAKYIWELLGPEKQNEFQLLARSLWPTVIGPLSEVDAQQANC
jgi:hypothetical protein